MNVLPVTYAGGDSWLHGYLKLCPRCQSVLDTGGFLLRIGYTPATREEAEQADVCGNCGKAPAAA